MEALAFCGLAGPSGSMMQAQGRWRLVTGIALLNWLLLVVSVGHTGWIDGTGPQNANPGSRGLDFHFGLQTFRYFEKTNLMGVAVITTTSYDADQALDVANHKNAGTHQVKPGQLYATLGLMVTAVVLQTLVLLALAQQRTGFFGTNLEVTWRARACSLCNVIFVIAAVGAFANAGYLDALKAAYDADKDDETHYGDGFNSAATSIAGLLIQLALAVVFAGSLEQVAKYYAALGIDSGNGIAAAAAGLSGTDEAASSGTASSAYTTLTPEERARILGKSAPDGDADSEEQGGGYQGSSAYASL